MKQIIILFFLVLKTAQTAKATSCIDLVTIRHSAQTESTNLSRLTGNRSIGIPNSYNSLKFLHFGERPPGFIESRKEILDFWTTNDPESFIISDTVTLSSDSSDGFIDCGTCHHMFMMHMRSFLYPILRAMGHENTISLRHLVNSRPRLDSGKFVLIFSKGELLGSLKLLGSESYVIEENGYFKHNPRLNTSISNPTFLALKNIVNSEGEITMLAGGIYYVDHNFFADVVIPEVNRQGPYLNPPGVLDKYGFFDGSMRSFLADYQVGVVDVDQLRLNPQTFLMHEASLNHPKYKDFWNQILEPFTQEEHSGESEMKNAWDLFLAQISKATGYIEEEYSQDSNLIDLREVIIRNLTAPNILNNSEFRNESQRVQEDSTITIDPFNLNDPGPFL